MKETVIIFRPSSEIHLKTHFVKEFFFKKLLQNIKALLKNNKIDFTLIGKYSGIIVFKTSNNNNAVPLLKKIFGIHSFSIAETHSFSSMDDLKELFLVFAKKSLSKGNSFALKISRNGKHAFSSKDVAVKCGQKIMDSIKGIKVNLSKPEKTIFADIIKNKVFLYLEKIEGIKGLPVGVEGKVGVLMQGKEEELVSGFLMMKRGCNIFPVITEINPQIKKNFELLSKWNSFVEFKPIFYSEIEKEKKFLSALILSERIQEKALREMTELAEQTGFVVFSPLTLFPEDKFKEILGLVKK